MPDRIRVAAIIGNLNREHGGAQQLLYNVFRRLSDEFEPTVYHLFGSGSFREAFQKAGVTVHHLEARSNLDPTAFGRLLDCLRADRPHVLQTNSPISGVWGRIAGRVTKVDRIVSVEQNVHHSYRTFPRLVNGLTLPLADAVVGVSRAVVDSLTAWERALLPASTRILSIPNGVDLDRFAPSRTDDETVPTNPPLVGTVGRLVEAKGFDRLLRAWPAVLETVPEARLEIVGDGPMHEQLEALAAELGVGGSVTLPGYRADPAPAYRRFDVAVFPSRWEGLPLAVMEAMATGVPVVTSDIPPMRQLAGEAGRAGLPVPGEDITQLARVIADLLRNPERRARLGAAGRERIRRHFSAERIATRYETLYRSLTGHGSDAAS